MRLDRISSAIKWARITSSRTKRYKRKKKGKAMGFAQAQNAQIMDYNLGRHLRRAGGTMVALSVDEEMARRSDEAFQLASFW